MGRAKGLRRVCAALVVVAAAATTAGAQDRAVELVTTGPADAGSLTEFDAVAISDDGATVAFSTIERLVSADEDDNRDVYVRRGGTTTIASQAERNGNLGIGTSGPVVSQDGSRVFFTTTEQLVPEDSDATRDVYEWQDGTTRLISGRAEGAPGPDADVLISTSRLPPPTGDRVILETTEKLLPGDGDTVNDLYERTAGGLRLLTGATDTEVVALDANRALTHVFFETTKDMLESDADGGQADTYMVSGDQLTHVSKASAAGSSGGRTWTDLVSADGSRALLATAEGLDAGDTDGAFDIYLWQAGGPVTWLSKPAGGAGCAAPPCPANTYGGASDLGRIAFTTAERLRADDTDDTVDLYAWTAAGGLELVSTGPNGGNAAAAVTEAIGARTQKMGTDGRGILFTTGEALVVEDTDAQVDLYERIDGATRLVSTGEIGASGGVPAGAGTYRAGSARVLFGSTTAFSRADTDDQLDLYLREEGTTRLLSVGRAAYDAEYVAASTDGGNVFFRTREQLAASDIDGGRDLYTSRRLPGPAPAPGGSVADTQPPELALRLTRTTFRSANRRATISARRKRTPLGTFLDVYANEGGQVNMTFSRLVPGRRSKGRCVATRRRVSRSQRCTRHAGQPGKLEFKIAGGRNRIRFYGRVGTRRFKAGRYAVFGRAYDAAGNRSRIASATFTVRSR